MASVIRVNTINSRSGLSTVTFDNSGTGIEVAGIVTATSFTGTLNTAAQGNITSLGTLSGLVIDNNANTSMSSGSAGQLVVGGDGYTGAIALDGDAMHIYHNSSSRAMVLGTDETERIRIKGDGKTFIHGGGATSANNTATILENGNTLNIHGTSSSDGISLVRYSANYGAYGINIGKSRNNTFGTNTLVQDGNELGHISFYGADGTDFEMAAQITAKVDGDPATGGDGTDMPGALSFRITPEGSDSPTERLLIASDGKVNITPGGVLSGNHPPGDLNIVGTNFLTMTPNDNSNASDNEILGQISFLPYAAGSVASASAKIEAVAESGQSGSANPTSLKFYTKPPGVGPGSAGTQRLQLTGGGQLIQYTTHTIGNSFHQNTNWYGDDANQYAIEIRDFNEMYATKTVNTANYNSIIYKREKMTHNCDIEFMLAGGSDQAGSGYYHLAMTICGDASDTWSNFDRLVFRCDGGTAGNNKIRIDKASGGESLAYQNSSIPQFFDGNDRHIQIKIRGRRFSFYSDGVEITTQYADTDNPRQNGFFGFAIYEGSGHNPWLKIRDFKLQNYSLNTSLPSWDVVKSVPASTNNLYHYTVTDLNNPRTVEIRFHRLRHSAATGRMLMRLGPSSGYITSGYYDIGTWRSDSDGGATITRGHNQGQWWPLNYDFNNPTNYYSGCITIRRISNSGRNTRIIYESTVTVDYDSGTTQYFVNNTGQMTFANNHAWDRLSFYNETTSAVLNYGELEILAQH